MLPASLEKVASTDKVQLVSPNSRHSCHGFRESPRGLVCCFEFCFKTWQSISVLAQAAGPTPLNINSAGNDISTKADGGKKCPDRHMVINHAALLQAVRRLLLNAWVYEAQIERQKTKKILLAGHSSDTICSREALGCCRPAPLLQAALGVASTGLGVTRWLHIQSTWNSLQMCNNQQCQGNAANSPKVSSKDFGQSMQKGLLRFRAGARAQPSRRGSLLCSCLENGARGNVSSPSWSLSDSGWHAVTGRRSRVTPSP